MWKSKFYGAFHAIDATPARWRGDAGAPDALVDFHTASDTALFRPNENVATCVEIKILRRVACSMAWRCRFLTARRSQHGSVIAEE